MMIVHRVTLSTRMLLLLSCGALIFATATRAQQRETILEAAREIIASVRYCALVTLDASGRPHVRTMDAFEPEAGMVVWMGTNAATRKVEEIRNDARVTLFYADGDNGYVAITGEATIVDDPEETALRWKEEWEPFYVNRDRDYILISVKPASMEVVSYRHGLVGGTDDWAAPTVIFD